MHAFLGSFLPGLYNAFTGVSGLTPTWGRRRPASKVVYDEGQKGLPGVAVSVWDGKLSYKAVTDFDGNFTIRGSFPENPLPSGGPPGAAIR